MKKLYLIILMLGVIQMASAQLSVGHLFSDHVVLQRQKPIPVWGWSAPGDAIAVTLAGKTLNVQAGADGAWRVSFPAMEAGGPYELEVSTQKEMLAVRDILIGEVWLCSGQSNMEWRVAQADHFWEERQAADYPQIRHYYVDHEVSLQPQKKLSSGSWQICSPETVGDFTAVGYFFAREIHQKLKVPVGLLHSSWGGSQVEGWISKEGMLGSEELKAYAQKLPASWEEADHRLERRIKNKLLGKPDALVTLEDEQQYLKPGYDFSGWWSADPMGQWDWKGIWAWRGNGYMGKMINIPATMAGKLSTLGLASCFSYNEIYINGKLVFAGILKGSRKIILPPGTWKAGMNSLMVKMDKVIEPEWYGLGLMGSPNELFVSTDDRKISLAGSDWKIMPAFAEPHTFAHSSNNVGTTIFNGMIAPVVPFGIRGVLWYQGESNAGRAYQYRHSFPLLIKDWREKWQEDFPFYFVQLADYGRDQDSNEGSSWAELREAQAMALSLPKTGMAVTIDIGNPDDIHPTNKQDVGMRLAAIALADTYGFKMVSRGPRYKSVRFEAGKALISFDHVGSGLVVKDRYQYLKGFEIAGEDRVFHYARAEIRGDEVVVYHPAVLKPVAVRYAWSDAPVDANLFNEEGFPAAPFRTDSWPGLTEGQKFE